METDSQNLRDFLRIKQEDHQSNYNRNASGRNISGMTLNAVLSDKRGQTRPIDEPLERIQSNRTLLDIIRDESGSGAYKDGKKSWKNFKDKLRLRRNGSGSNWTSSVRIPASDIPLNNNSTDRMMTTGRRSFTQFGESPESTQPNVRPNLLDRNSSRAIERASGRFEHTSSLAMRRLRREPNEDEEGEEENDDEEEESGGGSGSGGGEEEEEGSEQPVRTSLMALLAETDRQMGLDGLGYMLDEEEEEEEEEEESSGGREYNNCCVCMVRHKGAAFIPCGHTFCRLCSRELYAQRGNCPLCNNYILEILDIF